MLRLMSISTKLNESWATLILEMTQLSKSNETAKRFHQNDRKEERRNRCRWIAPEVLGAPLARKELFTSDKLLEKTTFHIGWAHPAGKPFSEPRTRSGIKRYFNRQEIKGVNLIIYELPPNGVYRPLATRSIARVMYVRERTRKYGKYIGVRSAKRTRKSATYLRVRSTKVQSRVQHNSIYMTVWV